MWEWTNHQNKLLQPQRASLLDAYSAYLPQNPSRKQVDSSKVPSLSEMQEALNSQIEAYNLHGLELRLLDFTPLSWEKKDRYLEEYIRSRKAFLKFIGYSHADKCLSCGMTEEDVCLLKQSTSPENFNIHIKAPFDFGGTPVFENLCLVRTHPTHNQIHTLLEYQLEKNFLRFHKKLYIPYIEGVLKND